MSELYNINYGYPILLFINYMTHIIGLFMTNINKTLNTLYIKICYKMDNLTRLRLVYILGNIDIILTPFLLFYNMRWAKYYHIFKFITLIPIRFHIFRQNKWHYYLLEFCYYLGLLFNLFILQELFWDGKFNEYFITLYMLANGPVLFAIYLNKDKLLLHSISHLTNYYLHLSPAIMAWALRWHNDGENFMIRYPPNFSLGSIISSLRYDIVPSIILPYMIWCLIYYICIFILGWKRINERDNLIMYKQFMNNKALGMNKVDRALKSPYMKGLFYIGVHLSLSLLTVVIATIMFNNYYINTFVIIMKFIVLTWYGSYKMMKSIEMYEKEKTDGITSDKTDGITSDKTDGIISDKTDGITSDKLD